MRFDSFKTVPDTADVMTSERVFSQLEAFWTGKQGKRLRAWLPGLISLVCLLGAAWVAAGLAWRWMPAPELPAPNRTLAGAETHSTANTGPGVEQLVKLHLFGKADAPAQTAKETAVDAPETQLNLALRGVMAADDKSMSRAIIASGNQAHTYGVDDSVPGGATVNDILADRVILNRNGRLEALSLPKHSMNDAFVPGDKAPKQADPSVMDMFSRQPQDQNAADKPKFKPSGPTPDPGQLRRMAKQDPAQLTRIARPEPVFENNHMVGFRLNPGRDHGALQAYGLQPGDVVTEINGQPLDNVAKSMQMLQRMDDSKSITLTIKRNGQTQQVQLQGGR